MYTYKITVEDMKCRNCGKAIQLAFEEESETAVVTFNVAKKEIYVDSDLPVEEIYQIIEDAGFTPGDLELI